MDASNLPRDPFGRSQMPPAFDREARVLLIGRAAAELMAGRLPDAPARLFVAGALLAWLQQGGRTGDLERLYLRTSGPERSRLTAPELFRRSCARTATDDAPPGTIAESSPHITEEPLPCDLSTTAKAPADS
jgi:hypothetical protein